MEFIALVLAIGALLAFRTLNKRTLALEGRLDETSQALVALRAALGRDGPGPAATDEAAPVVAPAPIVPPAETSVPLTPADAPEAAVPAVVPVSAAPKRSLEERLGTRWAVWVGGLALALGGVLMVRLSIEQGIFGPGARVILGLLFSAVLVGAGEWLRRGERGITVPGLEAAHIPSILTAAGTVAAFGTVYAAHALYDFIGPAFAFVALGAIGVATMFAAALHGPMLAGLGLAGAYIGPVLVNSATPSPWPVVLYLAVVAAAAHGLARLRQVAVARRIRRRRRVPVGDAVSLRARRPARPTGRSPAMPTCSCNLRSRRPSSPSNRISVPRTRTATPDRIAGAALLAMAILAVAMLADSKSELGGWVPFAAAAAGLLLATAWLSAPAAYGAALPGLPVIAVAAAWPGLAAPPEASQLGAVRRPGPAPPRQRDGLPGDARHPRRGDGRRRRIPPVAGADAQRAARRALCARRHRAAAAGAWSSPICG